MDPEFPRRIGLRQELHDLGHSLPSAYFADRALGAGLNELRSEGWPTREKSLDPLGEPLFRADFEHGVSAVFELEGALVNVNLWGSHLGVVAAARGRAELDTVFAVLRERFAPPDPSSSSEVPVTFWMYTPQGPQPAWRAIGVPSWDEIRDNYSAPTRAALDLIMRGFQPAHGGQLVLWHGLAGTGKTFALRALAWEWRDWCQLHYIVDPDAFFGEHADYLMSVLLQESSPMFVTRGGVFPMMGGWSSASIQLTGTDEIEETDGDEDEDSRLWRLLVLEDTGELLAADARAVMGQALSRFLNVVDGLIGQGLRVLVLVTTNEEIRTLHPAVARPGRSAANVEFTPLDGEEASEWLRLRGLDDGRAGEQTLASLYARLEGRDPVLATFADPGNGGDE